MKLIYVIMILAVIVSGCGGGGNTAVPSVNGSVTPSSGSCGNFSITVHISGPENMEAKVIPWQRKTLKVTVNPESGLTAITPVTVDISGSGDYTATVPNVPAGLNEATIEVLDANNRLLAMRKHGFQMDHGGDVKPTGKIIMGVSLDPAGGLHCDPNYIEIKKGESLYVENQDTGAGYTVTIGSESHSVSAATASVSPVTAAMFPAEAFGTFSGTAGVYNISAGGPVLGTVKVYDYNASFVPDMVLITAGTFQMGDPNGGVGASNERPRHEVTLTRNFYMSKYEIRNKEYICYDPAHTSGGGWSDPNYPAENISWYDAVTYCNWLSAQQGLPLCYTDSDNDGNLDTVDITKDGYRLPTEAEWEYACRAGETTFHDYYWGDDGTSPPDIGTYCWYGSNSGSHPNIVGTKLANNFGLFDMNGNLWEWVNDWYGSYNGTAQTDPDGPGSGSIRVIRGGGWFNMPVGCRSAGRGSINIPSSCGSGIGFRPVLTDLTDYSGAGYTISSFTPGSGDEGDTVTINGTFHSNPSSNIVTFNGVYTPTLPTSITNELHVKVPAGPTTGKISVTTPGGTVTSEKYFYPMELRTDDSCTLSQFSPTTITFSHDFYVGRYEITNAQYRLWPAAASHHGNTTELNDVTYDNYPVRFVNWMDVCQYCNWLSSEESLTSCYTIGNVSDHNTYTVNLAENGYRLPTEAEWEYACRGGNVTEYYWGDTMNADNCWHYYSYPLTGGIYTPVNGSGYPTGPHSIGFGGSHPWGLYDMSGNVWEWCHNVSETPPAGGSDPKGPDTGAGRSGRSGSWFNAPVVCRSAYRGGGSPDLRDNGLGFRPVRTK